MTAHGRSVAGVSFPLQFFLVIVLTFAPFWFFLTLGLMIFKTVELPFPSTEAIVFEYIGMTLVWIVIWQAGELAKRGNLTEQAGPLGVGTAMLVVAAGGTVYYMRFQTYVMRLDLGFSATLLALLILCVLLGMAALQSVSNTQRPGAQKGGLGSVPGVNPAASDLPPVQRGGMPPPQPGAASAGMGSPGVNAGQQPPPSYPTDEADPLVMNRNQQAMPALQ